MLIYKYIYLFKVSSSKMLKMLTLLLMGREGGGQIEERININHPNTLIVTSYVYKS